MWNKVKRINDWLKSQPELALAIGLVLGLTVGGLL